MAERARLSPPRPEFPAEWPWHKTRWASLSVSTLWGGDRRLEADAYLASGYGERLAIEGRPSGWRNLEALARVWQPSRLKGIQVAPAYGTPFLAATQVFDLRPNPRKFLSLDRTDALEERFVSPGSILVTRSGNVGRATLAYRSLEGVIVSDDLLRVDPFISSDSGWVYAFLRSSRCRAMMSSAQYGHVIKHLEVSHLNALPVPSIEDWQRDEFQSKVSRVLEMRNKAVDLMREGEDLLSDAVGPLEENSAELGFSVASSDLFRTRRRLEATFHSPKGRTVLEAYARRNLEVESLSDVTERVWWLTRFKRVFGEGGMPYLSSDELFSVNPPVTKRVMIEQAEAPDDYFVKAGWIMMACSGQTYGLNGSVALLDERHQSRFFSHDIVRIVPDRQKIRPGYLYAVLGHPTLGRPLVIRNAYGTSIPHLDPSDVATIPVVRLVRELETRIADAMEKAAALRAEADDLETAVGIEADEVIEDFIHYAQ